MHVSSLHELLEFPVIQGLFAFLDPPRSLAAEVAPGCGALIEAAALRYSAAAIGSHWESASITASIRDFGRSSGRVLLATCSSRSSSRAQESRIVRFSSRVNQGYPTTSPGSLKVPPGSTRASVRDGRETCDAQSPGMNSPA